MKSHIIVFFLIATLVLISGCAENTKKGQNATQAPETVIIGTKPFQESDITANMISLLLENQGYKTEVKENFGGTLVNYAALKEGDIQSYVEYTGTIYSVILKKPPLKEWDPEEVYKECEQGMLTNDSVEIAASLGFENAYAIAVDKGWAEAHGVSNISDLAPYAPELTLGTDQEFDSREDGLPQIIRIYGFKFKSNKSMAQGAMYEAMRDKKVDAISAYTTDPRNDLYGIKVLNDDKHALPPYDAVILVSRDFAQKNPKAMEALGKLNNRINEDTMRRLNAEYDINGRSARDTAQGFLVSENLISI
jgi:osmoprotectant transport system substrate-binding protein